MASNTPNLNLLKKDPVTDGDDTFNIKTMLNDNWDKIDAALGQVDIPDASLTVKGKVQLSSATDSAAEDRAVTPKAVKEAALQAKSYTDQQISLVTETGIPKLVSYPLLVTATADNQKVFEIPLDLFDANTDTLLVAINRAVLDATQYTVTNTVRDGAGQVTQQAKINLLSGVAATSEVTMVVLKNVPIGPDGAINGAVLATGSVPINRVDGLQDKLDQAFQAGNERKSQVVAALVALGISASTNDSWDSLVIKLNGIINRGAGGTVTPGTANQTKEAGYYSSAITIKGDANLVAGNIKSGVNIFNVVGTLQPEIYYEVEGPSILGKGERYTVNLPFVAKAVFVSARNTDNNTYGSASIGFIVKYPPGLMEGYSLAASGWSYCILTLPGERNYIPKSTQEIPQTFDIYRTPDAYATYEYNFKIRAWA
ncbi:phage tail protein [Paenibacillus motobuensis]|uniref:phage tail protein n=1 Tax=Paenibacillus TaxID=44249 RepID=UPI00204140F0|nr:MULTISPECIES: phage tail protein [Paenibacillus]MCM3040722.1 phage tail protein [Paenibacillus lutimineralis]MCM3647826.1 phage tail protein [Paenibacillus motobuensis]